ncbi:hypothetical protein QCD67_06545 [Enterobacter roggenkampii]|uniref:hypothetical protein n=1 Tax=Enterobacter roggenkampii TaxID=1812935 RepID=UPI00244D1EF5|nr:hypothetical protein [Enterobacter roggenkampii]WGG56876.1 hypothetical protein QCD67_06545 [Enterobacter roggenkampii]
MTANKPMTGEQLDELMTVAVNMQRDAETDCNRPSAMFAYAVQVAVLELRKVRNDASALAAENAGLKQFPDQIVGFIGKLGSSEIGSETKEKIEAAAKKIKTPATDAFLAEVRAQGVDMFAASLGSPYVERGEECYQDGYTHAIERIKCHKAPEFAAQLRKGVQS